MKIFKEATYSLILRTKNFIKNTNKRPFGQFQQNKYFFVNILTAKIIDTVFLLGAHSIMYPLINIQMLPYYYAFSSAYIDFPSNINEENCNSSLCLTSSHLSVLLFFLLTAKNTNLQFMTLVSTSFLSI